MPRKESKSEDPFEIGQLSIRHSLDPGRQWGTMGGFAAPHQPHIKGLPSFYPIWELHSKILTRAWHPAGRTETPNYKTHAPVIPSLFKKSTGLPLVWMRGEKAGWGAEKKTDTPRLTSSHPGSVGEGKQSWQSGQRAVQQYPCHPKKIIIIKIGKGRRREEKQQFLWQYTQLF